MGKAATAFKDIGKACSDLLTKDYKVGKSTVEVKTKTSNGVTFTPSGTKTGPDKFASSLLASYNFPGGVEGEVTLHTSGVVESTFKHSPMSGVTVTLDCERPAPKEAKFLSSAKCTVDYKNDLMTNKTSYECYSGALATAGSFAYDALTFGCSVDYSTTKNALTKYAAACQFVQKDFSVIAKCAQAVGKGSPAYTGMYFHKVSDDMQVGAELTHTSGKDLGLAFGCAYKLDKNTTVKGKVDADGMLYSSYKQKISSLTTMTLAAQIDTVNLSDNKHKFGMILNLTP
jgi:voltage-dependent anion channel protein 2